jgi:hypothetical protein
MTIQVIIHELIILDPVTGEIVIIDIKPIR